MDYLGQVRAKKRVPLKKAIALAEKIYEKMVDFTDFDMIVGSIRRQRPEVGDIEFVVLPKDLNAFLKQLDKMGYFGGNRKRTAIIQGLKVEVYIAHVPEELGAMIFTYTGDWLFNVAMRSIAKRRGWKLDQYGIQDAETGEWILQSPYEEDFFGALGVDYHTPEERSFAHRKKASMGDIGPRDWSPRSEIPGHTFRFNDYLKRINWDGREWRPADKELGEGHYVWYGPGGEEGDEATELERYSGTWIIREFSRQESPGPNDILQLTAYFDDDLFQNALYMVNDMKVSREELEGDPREWHRYAVGLGVTIASYQGGDESWVDSLP